MKNSLPNKSLLVNLSHYWAMGWNSNRIDHHQFHRSLCLICSKTMEQQLIDIYSIEFVNRRFFVPKWKKDKNANCKRNVFVPFHHWIWREIQSVVWVVRCQFLDKMITKMDLSMQRHSSKNSRENRLIKMTSQSFLTTTMWSISWNKRTRLRRFSIEKRRHLIKQMIIVRWIGQSSTSARARERERKRRYWRKKISVGW